MVNQKDLIKINKQMFSKQLSEPDLLLNSPNHSKSNIYKFGKSLKQDKKNSSHTLANVVLENNLNVLEKVEEEKSGWSSRASSQKSKEDEDLIEGLHDDLKSFIKLHHDLKLLDSLEVVKKRINNEFHMPKSDELSVKICSGNYMFNKLHSYGNQVLIFDFRSMYQILRGYLDHNL